MRQSHMLDRNNRLHAAIGAACPNYEGVAVPDWSDRSTWVVHFTGAATDEQKAAAQAAIDAFVIDP